jgi:hypothetical protein
MSVLAYAATIYIKGPCLSNQTSLHFSNVSLSDVAPTLEQRASVKRFVSLQFLNPRIVGRTTWTGDQPFARPLPTQTQNIRRDPCLEWRAKTVHASDRAATVVGISSVWRMLKFCSDMNRA